jgi:hypothetical protein
MEGEKERNEVRIEQATQSGMLPQIWGISAMAAAYI